MKNDSLYLTHILECIRLNHISQMERKIFLVQK